ncbi:MAG: insulinase family protein [Gammaproteobacteria bacterium]|nr:MAG: insulinase family protein [Gammaproteobacteria bacterium]
MTLQKLRFLAVLILFVFHGTSQAVPAIQHWITNNGARVYFVPAAEIPIVDVRVVFDAGSARDHGKSGLATLTNSLIIHGAGKLDYNTISERLDQVGAQMDAGALRDMAWLSMRTLSDEAKLGESMGILSLILSKPLFPDNAFNREKKVMLVGLAAEKQKPSAIAERAFMKHLYGDHPYASSPNGTVDSVNSIQPADVRAFYDRYYVANNAVIAIVGDLDRSNAQTLAEKLSSGMKSGKRAESIPPVPTLTEAKTVHMEHPSTQTHIWMGQPGMSRTEKDYFPLYIGNHTLGGSGLVSLLSEEVREKRGFAYSVYSYFSPMRGKGPYEMVLQTKNEHAMEAMSVMRDTARDYLASGITKEQLKASKQNITGGFALRIDSNKKIAEYLAMIGFYGLPLDYLNNFISRVEAVTQEQVNDAFRRRVDPDKMLTVIVGPKMTEKNTASAATHR